MKSLNNGGGKAPGEPFTTKWSPLSQEWVTSSGAVCQRGSTQIPDQPRLWPKLLASLCKLAVRVKATLRMSLNLKSSWCLTRALTPTDSWDRKALCMLPEEKGQHQLSDKLCDLQGHPACPICWFNSGTDVWEWPTTFRFDLRPTSWNRTHEGRFLGVQEPDTRSAVGLRKTKTTFC